MLRKTHLYFILKPSPWPLVVRGLALSIMFSFLIFVKFFNPLIFFYRMVGISVCCFSWWFNYSKEFNLEGKETINLENGLKYAIVLFISSEIFFFFSFFWSYFHFFLSPVLEIRGQWPPICVEMFDCLEVPLVNTLLLVMSGVTITIRHHFLVKGSTIPYTFFLVITFLLGAIFSFFQWSEYDRSFFTLRDSTFGTSFFILTGFHGIHVLIGTIFLIVIFLRRRGLRSAKSDYSGFELASWYWHFVDVVWLFLYFCLYYINN